jgi:hypothetical protein
MQSLLLAGRAVKRLEDRILLEVLALEAASTFEPDSAVQLESRKTSCGTDADAMAEALLPGLPVDLILACYAAAPGNELESGKFASPESSAALAANAFGPFLTRPGDLPSPPGGQAWGWPASSVRLEATLRLPWRGGRHPCLDALIETSIALIGVESKRYEPFRAKPAAPLSEAYWRPVWGDAMAGYKRVRESLRDGGNVFTRLDAAQLVKHALGLRTAVRRKGPLAGKRPVLLYLYAEPERWPDGRPLRGAEIEAHRAEVRDFAGMVAGDEVVFSACSYRELLSAWSGGPSAVARAHAAAIATRFLL